MGGREVWKGRGIGGREVLEVGRYWRYGGIGGREVWEVGRYER